MSELKILVCDDTNGYLPPEMWAKIFKWVDTMVGTKSLLNLRLVCKGWGEIIDSHLYFQPNVNDEQLEISRLSHLRVETCVIGHLTSPLSHEQILFRNPSLVKTLTLEGFVTRENFMIMVAQFTNLEQLSIKKVHLEVPGYLIPTTNEESTNLSRLLLRLKKLELEFGSRRYLRDDVAAHNNLQQVFHTNMKNLEDLKLNFGWFNLQDSGLLPFLWDHVPNLKHLWINCWRGYEKTSKQVGQNLPPNPEFRTLHLQNLQLCVSNTFWKTNWMPIIELQRSLQILNIEIRQETQSAIDAQTFPKYGDLEETLVQNSKTLTSLKLRNFMMSEYLNFNLLKGIDKLKTVNLVTRPSASGKVLKFSMPSSPSTSTQFNWKSVEFKMSAYHVTKKRSHSCQCVFCRKFAPLGNI